ncbi:SLATT domain-containing protein [Rheinheimera sp.]|uniref:SLATT domain-containing protein n=1 Tax=Rheinheimera sp. TaxID=1869214 RepID=UPI00307F4537
MKNVDALKNKAWFTYKARIMAHERLMFLNKASQYLLIWYSLITVISSIVMIRFPMIFGSNGDILLTCISLFVLVLSLVVSNRDYRGREIEMRKNYLELQNLYRELEFKNEIPIDEFSKVDDRYQLIIAKGENHTEFDDLTFRVKNSTTRKPAWHEFIFYYVVKTAVWLFLIAFIITPLIIIFGMYSI